MTSVQDTPGMQSQRWIHADPEPGSLSQASLPDPGPLARYPLTISADRRRLLDADGRPFLIQGDAAWSLVANLDYADAVRYLDDRRAKGFNTIIVNLVEHLFSRNPPRDSAGREPFSRPGDMSTPNDSYFDAAERVLEACAARGIRRHPGAGLCRLSPRPRAAVCRLISTAGMTRSSPRGRRAAAAMANISAAGSAASPTSSGASAATGIPAMTRPGLDAIAKGLRSAGVTTLFTAHPHPEYSPIESFPGADWLDLNVTYTYGVVHRSLIADWQRNPPWPFFLVESTYEGEHNASQLQIRRQAYWSVLCGGNGHCMGNHPDLAVLGRLAGRPRAAGLGRDGALGRLLSRAALERARPRSRAPARVGRSRRGARPRSGHGG